MEFVCWCEWFCSVILRTLINFGWGLFVGFGWWLVSGLILVVLVLLFASTLRMVFSGLVGWLVGVVLFGLVFVWG